MKKTALLTLSTMAFALVGMFHPASAEVLRVRMVFQSFNLFPHLKIIDNLMLAPRLVHEPGDYAV